MSAFHNLMPQRCVCVCVYVEGGGGTLIFSYTDVVCDHFWGFKILNFNIFGGFLKSDAHVQCMNYQSLCKVWMLMNEICGSYRLHKLDTI